MSSLTEDQELVRAEAILSEAKNHELISKDTSELANQSKIKLANAVVKQAQKAYKNKERGEHVTSILFAADEDFTQASEDDDEALYESILASEVETGLPVPHVIEGDPPQLPLDLSELSDKEVRWLHGAFNACSARVTWLYSVEEGGEAAAKQIADHHEEKYITNTERKDIGGKPKPQALLKAEAKEADPDILKWRKRERKHSISAGRYKRLVEIYNNNCDRLSREWTMRIDERKNS
jgi:hypothetical protein